MTLRRDSLQMTFMLKGESQDPEKEVMLQLYGHTYKVNTHSFLCYGRDQVLKRLLLKVVQVSVCQGGAHLLHDCFKPVTLNEYN